MGQAEGSHGARRVAERLIWELPGGVWATFTDRSDGDLAPASAGVEERRAAVIQLPWSCPSQVHGAEVLEVTAPGGGRGVPADALITEQAGLAISVVTADCVPVALASPEGLLGVAHAGWRGLVAGVLEATVGAMRARGASRVSAVIGPCIGAECYEFGPRDLELVAARLGPTVRAQTKSGTLALDVTAATRAALATAGAELFGEVGVCTACSSEHYSHRARKDPERQAAVAWRL